MSRPESDLWKELVADAGVEAEDAIARAASVSVKEAEEELAAAGFDVAAERAKASAFLDALESGALETEPESHIPEPPPSAAVAVAQDAAPARRQRQRPVVLWLAGVAAIVVAAGALYAALSQPPRPGPPAPSPSTPAPLPPDVPDLVAAADLRHQAAAACDAKQWTACLAKLDQARATDPDGDGAPTVKALRDRATAGLAKKPDPPLP
jgi:hypothetical protein